MLSQHPVVLVTQVFQQRINASPAVLPSYREQPMGHEQTLIRFQRHPHVLFEQATNEIELVGGERHDWFSNAGKLVNVLQVSHRRASLPAVRRQISADRPLSGSTRSARPAVAT